MRIKYLLAKDDHSWDEVTISVPDEVAPTTDDLTGWADRNLLTQAQYRDYFFAGVLEWSEDDTVQPLSDLTPFGTEPVPDIN